VRIATIIYFLSALAYVAWDIELIVSYGPQIGSILMVILAAGFLSMSYSLVRNKPHARTSAILCSFALVLAFGYIAISLVYPPSALSFREKMSITGVIFGAAVAVAVAHLIALASLLLGRDRRS
jgi:hypothetical protein